LSKGEFNTALHGVTFKVQDDNSGKLDVIFVLNQVIYNMNPSGMPTPQLNSTEIMDSDFTPLKPISHTNLI
jgi:hypothetical protein